MTILNVANDGLYGVLVVLCRALRQYGSRSQESLETLCAGKGGDTSRVRHTINRWTELGLFSNDGDKVRFAPDGPVSSLSSRTPLDEFTMAIPSLARSVAFDDANNSNLWAVENNRAADLSRGLAWLLAQDIYEFPLGVYANAEEIAILQMATAKGVLVQNDVRWTGLRDWAHFLGFSSRAGKREYMDPTRAMLDVLPKIFAKGRTLSAAEFTERLALELPILDGGRFRRAVEQELDPEHWPAPATPRTLSTSLSHGMWRLRLDDVLHLEQRSDTGEPLTLVRAGGATWVTFSHVTWAANGRKS